MEMVEGKKPMMVEYNIGSDHYRVSQSDDGFYHIGMNDREDIHGPMSAEALISWMSNVIYNLAHLVGKK